MTTFPQNNVGLLCIHYVLGYGIRYPRFEILRADTVRNDRILLAAKCGGGLDTLQRGVQWMVGAVDGGSII